MNTTANNKPQQPSQQTYTLKPDKRRTAASFLKLEGQAYFNFIHSVKAQASKTQYNVGLKRFMVYTHAKTVDELLYLKGTLFIVNYYHSPSTIQFCLEQELVT
jgi:hypothetical protein